MVTLLRRGRSRDGERLIGNLLSLSVLQGMNYVYPIVTAPYVIRVIGIQQYGLWATASVLLTYFQLFTDYGFNLSATREISVNRHDPRRVSQVFGTVMSIKAGLFLASALLMLALTWGIPALRQDRWLYLITFSGLLGSVLFPVWLFQGVEQMKYITYLHLASRTLAFALLFVVVREEGDLVRFAALNSAAAIVTGCASCWIVLTRFGVRYVAPTAAAVRASLRDGWHIFLSTCSINMYVNSNVLILRLLTDEATVGYYYVAERCVTAVRGLASTVFQAIYPHACATAMESDDRFRRFFRRTALPLLALFGAAGLALFASSRYVVHFFTGEPAGPAVTILRILAFVPLVVAANIPAYQTLLAYDLKRSYTAVLVSGSALNVMLNLALASRWQGTGTAVSVLLTELFITAGLYLVIELRHRDHSLFRTGVPGDG